MALAYVNEPCKGHGSLYCRDDDCNPKLGYKRHQVEALLAVMWNGGSLKYEWDGPAPGMPRAARDPRMANELEIALMDMSRTWANSELPTTVAMWTYLRYGRDLTWVLIGKLWETTPQNVSEQVNRAVGHLTERMNGNPGFQYKERK